MKRIILFLSLLSALSAHAQVFTLPTMSVSGGPNQVNWNRGGVTCDSALWLPYMDTTTYGPTFWRKIGRIAINKKDSLVYVDNGKKWTRVGLTINAGANVNITGQGTVNSPMIISSTAGAGGGNYLAGSGIGIAGTTITADTSTGNLATQPFVTNALSSILYVGTISGIRALTGTKYSLFYTTDPGKAGIWYLDKNDSTSLDNTGTILVTSGGKRLKRLKPGGINVSDFGADKTGVTNSDTAFKLAYAAAYLTRQAMTADDGTYLLTVPFISILSPGGYGKFHFIGQSQDNTILKFIPADSAGEALFNIAQMTNCSFRNFSVVGDQALSAGSRRGIAFKFGTPGNLSANVSNFSMDNVSAVYLQNGLKYYNGWTAAFYHNRFVVCDTGIQLLGNGTSNQTNQLDFTSCTASACNVGVNLQSGDIINFFGGDIEGNKFGIKIASTLAAQFHNLYYEANDSGHFYVGQDPGNYSGNIVVDGGSYAYGVGIATQSPGKFNRVERLVIKNILREFFTGGFEIGDSVRMASVDPMVTSPSGGNGNGNNLFIKNNAYFSHSPVYYSDFNTLSLVNNTGASFTSLDPYGYMSVIPQSGLLSTFTDTLGNKALKVIPTGTFAGISFKINKPGSGPLGLVFRVRVHAPTYKVFNRSFSIFYTDTLNQAQVKTVFNFSPSAGASDFMLDKDFTFGWGIDMPMELAKIRSALNGLKSVSSLQVRFYINNGVGVTGNDSLIVYPVAVYNSLNVSHNYVDDVRPDLAPLVFSPVLDNPSLLNVGGKIAPLNAVAQIVTVSGRDTALVVRDTTGTAKWYVKSDGTTSNDILPGSSQTFATINLTSASIGVNQVSPLAFSLFRGTMRLGGNTNTTLPNGIGGTFVPQLVVIDSNNLLGYSGIAALAMDGTNNRRVGLFEDAINNLQGLSMTSANTLAPFVIRQGGSLGEVLRLSTSGYLSLPYMAKSSSTADSGAVITSSGEIRKSYPPSYWLNALDVMNGTSLQLGGTSTTINQTSATGINYLAGSLRNGTNVAPGGLLDGTGSSYTPGVGSTKTSGVAGFSAYINDGTLNRRFGFGMDNTNNAAVISVAYASGTAPVFKIRYPIIGDILTMTAGAPVFPYIPTSAAGGTDSMLLKTTTGAIQVTAQKYPTLVTYGATAKEIRITRQDGTFISSANLPFAVPGTVTKDGDGSSLTYTISPATSTTLTWANVQAGSAAAAGITYVTTSGTTIIVHYSVAPPAGTGNLYYYYQFN